MHLQFQYQRAHYLEPIVFKEFQFRFHISAFSLCIFELLVKALFDPLNFILSFL
jgi:hypothetical protein